MGQRRGLQFNCTEEWESMLPMGKDRFCTSCSKPVIDFTSWGQDRITAWLKEHPNTCGQYRMEQLEPDLIPLDELTAGVRRGLAATLVAMALQTAHAQSPAVVVDPVEQGDATLQPPEVSPGILHAASVPMPMPVITAREPSAPAVRPQHRWYVSRRFPFIHRRSIHRRGMRVGF